MKEQRKTAWKISAGISIGIYLLIFFTYWDYFIPFEWVLDIPDWHPTRRLGLVIFTVCYVWLMYFYDWYIPNDSSPGKPMLAMGMIIGLLFMGAGWTTDMGW